MIRKTSVGAIKNEIISNKELPEELNKTIIKKFKKRKVHSSFIDNIWGADLANTQLIRKFDKGFRFLFCVIDIYRKYALFFPFFLIWVVVGRTGVNFTPVPVGFPLITQKQ